MNLLFNSAQPLALSSHTRLQNPLLLHFSKVAPIDQVLRFDLIGSWITHLVDALNYWNEAQR